VVFGVGAPGVETQVSPPHLLTSEEPSATADECRSLQAMFMLAHEIVNRIVQAIPNTLQLQCCSIQMLAPIHCI
jgi:hypothetical protein